MTNKVLMHYLGAVKDDTVVPICDERGVVFVFGSVAAAMEAGRTRAKVLPVYRYVVVDVWMEPSHALVCRPTPTGYDFWQVPKGKEHLRPWEAGKRRIVVRRAQ